MAGGVGAQAMKRIPRIKFPQRHPKSSSGNCSESKSKNEAAIAASDDSHNRAFSSSIGVYGKASDHPKRTLISNDEIEAILLGGCI